jgi:hypothetical protein
VPERVQLSRRKGYRKPDGAIVVARPTRWGNPFAYRDQIGGLVHYGPAHEKRFGRAWDHEGRISVDGMRHDMWFSSDDVVETHVRWATRAELVELYRLTISEPTWGMRMALGRGQAGHFLKVTVDDIRTELAGHDLACWCPLDQPCHADILLAIANGETVHRCPIEGEFLTPCCDRTTFELPATDRLTVHDVLVNCTRSGER